MRRLVTRDDKGDKRYAACTCSDPASRPFGLPAIDVQVFENLFTPEDRRDLVAKLTDAFGSVAGETMLWNCSVCIHELKSGDWCCGGEALTTETGLEMRRRG